MGKTPMLSKKPLLPYLALVAFLPACIAAGRQTQELTRAKQVRLLSADEAKLQKPVRVRGQVLLLSGWKNSFFLTDGTAGISVDRRDTLPELHPGDMVEVAGKSAPGAFAPIILSDTVRVLGNRTLPPAPPRSYAQLTGGAEDSQWVEVQGVARAAWIAPSWGRPVLFIDLDLGGGHVIARVHDFFVQDPSFLVDARIKLRGVCGTNFNDRRQFVGVRLFVANMEAVTVEEAAPSDPFALPLEPLETMAQFSPGQKLEHRHRVSGIVTYQKVGEGLYVQNGHTGLYIETAQPTPVKVGDRIEAVGFAGAGSYSPHLHNALFRVSGEGVPAQPISLRADQLIVTNSDGFLTSPYDGLLVSIRGRLLERVAGPNQDELVVRDGDQVFRAYLSREGEINGRSGLRSGSEVALTGIAAISSNESGEPSSFNLKLRDANDVVLLRSPSWWDTRHSLYVLTLAVLAVLACLLAVALLRRRIRHQAELIRELERVIETRERGSAPIEAPLRRWATVGFSIAILLTSLLSLLSWRGARLAEADDLWVAHTNQVLDAIATASAHLVELETSGRAFSLSGQSALLTRYERGDRNVTRDLDELRRLTLDNPSQQQRLLLLQQSAHEAVSFAAQLVAKRKLGPYPAGADAVTMERIIGGVDGRLGDLRTEETRLLAERTGRSRVRRSSTNAITALGMTLGVGFLILAGFATYREINLNAMARAQTSTLNAALNRKSAALQSEVSERKLAEQALRESDAKRSFALDTAKLGEWSLDLATMQASCSLRHYQVFGYRTPPPQWNMDVFLSHVDPDEHSRVREVFQRCISEQQRWNFETRIVCLDGEIRWIWTCGDWQLSPLGEPIALSGVTADITERKRAEQELADVKFALDQHAIVAITDVQGTIVYANDKFCAISKFSRGELIGCNHRLLNSGYHAKDFFQEMYRTVAKGKTWQGEIQNRAKDGSLYWVDTTIIPLMKSGKPSQYIAIRTDITERKRVELMHAHLTTAAGDSSDNAVSSNTLDSIITSWNVGAERLYGYSPEEAVGMSVLRLLPPERMGEETAIMAQIARGESVDHFETERLHKDGTRIDVSVFSSPIRDMSGAIIGASKVTRNMTQRKAAEREIVKLNEALQHRNESLERSNIELQQFAYIASHDLQSPLRSISGFVELLKMEYADKLDQRGCNWIERTVVAITQMQALIRDVLAYSKVDSRALPFAPVALSEVVHDAARLLDCSIRDAGAEVTLGELPVIAGDRSQLVQLIQNLIGNALTYHGEEAPRIWVGAEQRGDAWEVLVRDNGIGIEPRHHQRIFEIFKRLQHPKEYPGTGIGLAVCRRVVERHGGRIWVESEAGRGSTFHFTIPKRTDTINEEPDREHATSANTSS